MKNLKKFSPLLLRIGISLAFIWFGFTQLNNPGGWVGLIPDYVLSIGISAKTLVLFNGVFDLVFGILLLIGIYVRPVSLLLGIHLLHTSLVLGLSPSGVRDFALALATLSIFLNGPDDFCIKRFR
jgi:uncharacterized membrane protein YphA (DoxX/SURF4 family)